MLTPRGKIELVDLLGPAGGAQASAGLVKLPKALKLGWSDEYITRFACHILLQEKFTKVFSKIHAEGFWSELKTFDGCYDNRLIKGSSKKSSHAWGAAVDLNSATNRPDSVGDMHGQVILIFEEEGFIWGGHFSGKRRDPMHFQYVRDY